MRRESLTMTLGPTSERDDAGCFDARLSCEAAAPRRGRAGHLCRASRCCAEGRVRFGSLPSSWRRSVYPLARMPFSVAGPTDREATTGADGNVGLAGLPPGEYSVLGGPPGDFVRNAIFCAPASAPGTPFPSAPSGTTGIEIDLAADDDVLCDRYSVPEYRGGPTPTSAATPATGGSEPPAPPVGCDGSPQRQQSINGLLGYPGVGSSPPKA